MKCQGRSLSRILINNFILIVIAILVFFATQIIIDLNEKKEVHVIQDKIALINQMISLVQQFETNFDNYIALSDGEYVHIAIDKASSIDLIIKNNPEIFQQSDQIIIFSHAAGQITQAISELLASKIYNKLNQEDAFSSIKLAEVGFELLTQSIFSISSGFMEYTSNEIEEINKKYEMTSIVRNALFLVAFIILLMSSLSILHSTKNSFSIIARAANDLTNGQWLSDELPESKYTEIDISLKAFNKMKRTIRSNIDALNERIQLKELLAEKTIENEKQLRIIQETKFRLLQAQINPHFLFNTLNMITNSVRKGDRNKESANMLVATSRLLRDSIEITQNTISLEQELKMLDNYILIQGMRNRGRVEIRKEIEEDLPYVQIPPFSLQPLVENSIMHGLKDTIVGGMIIISVFSDDEGGIFISIHDNGIGIKKDVMEKALSGQLNSNGLGNVIKRLKMQYHNDDIIMFSKSGIGSTINLHLKVEGKGNDA